MYIDRALEKFKGSWYSHPIECVLQTDSRATTSISSVAQSYDLVGVLGDFESRVWCLTTLLQKSFQVRSYALAAYS